MIVPDRISAPEFKEIFQIKEPETEKIPLFQAETLSKREYHLA
jgi:hypothetical protein